MEATTIRIRIPNVIVIQIILIVLIMIAMT